MFFSSCLKKLNNKSLCHTKHRLGAICKKTLVQLDACSSLDHWSCEVRTSLDHKPIPLSPSHLRKWGNRWDTQKLTLLISPSIFVQWGGQNRTWYGRREATSATWQRANENLTCTKTTTMHLFLSCPKWKCDASNAVAEAAAFRLLKHNS